MGRRRHTPEQIITALREAEVGLAGGKTVGMVSRELVPPKTSRGRRVVVLPAFNVQAVRTAQRRQRSASFSAASTLIRVSCSQPSSGVRWTYPTFTTATSGGSWRRRGSASGRRSR